MDYTQIEPAPESEQRTRIKEAVQGIERSARMAGRSDVLMELDRVPMLVLGPENTVPQDAEGEADLAAMLAIERIAELVEAADGKTGEAK